MILSATAPSLIDVPPRPAIQGGGDGFADVLAGFDGIVVDGPAVAAPGRQPVAATGSALPVAAIATEAAAAPVDTAAPGVPADLAAAIDMPPPRVIAPTKAVAVISASTVPISDATPIVAAPLVVTPVRPGATSAALRATKPAVPMVGEDAKPVDDTVASDDETEVPTNPGGTAPPLASALPADVLPLVPPPVPIQERAMGEAVDTAETAAGSEIDTAPTSRGRDRSGMPSIVSMPSFRVPPIATAAPDIAATSVAKPADSSMPVTAAPAAMPGMSVSTLAMTRFSATLASLAANVPSTTLTEDAPVVIGSSERRVDARASLTPSQPAPPSAAAPIEAAATMTSPVPTGSPVLQASAAVLAAMPPVAVLLTGAATPVVAIPTPVPTDETVPRWTPADPVAALALVAPRAEPAPVQPGTVASAALVFGAAIQAATKRQDEPALPTDAAVTATPAVAPTAAVARAATADTPLDMRQERWPHAMIERIAILRDAANETDTRIRLIPDALGTIDVSVKRDGDTVQVRFVAEQAATRAILQDAQPRLADLAEQRGLKLAQGSVDTGTSGQQPQRQATPQPAQAKAPPRAARSAHTDSTDSRLA